MKKLCLLLLLPALIYMAGCSKTTPAPASITGTWTATSQRIQYATHHAIFRDTTYNLPTGYIVFSFNANGYYTLIESGNTSGSGYFVHNNVLSLFDTTASGNHWQSFSITTLSASNLSLQDTGYTSIDTMVLATINFIR
jgi:hypothetical protein